MATVPEPIAPPRKRRPRRRGVIVASLMLWHASFASDGIPPLEYQVKASYLYNFLQFVEWPADAWQGETVQLCIIGENNFGRALQAIAGETVRGRIVVVAQIADPSRLTACHVVFVSASERGREAEILRQVANRPVLTVGETPGFTDRGGTINLVQRQDKIRFEINQQKARDQGLKISSHLLRLGLSR